VVEVNRMIKQFNQMKKMMNQMSKGNFNGMEGMLGNGIKGKLSKMAMNSMIKKK
jgi:signal recognition particle subunit SRP54